MRTALALLIAHLLVAGCACHFPVRRFLHQAPGDTWVRTELMFGLKLKDGTTISDSQWRTFLDQEITPRFPDGLTILEGYGQWRDQAGHVTSEPSKILILLHPPDKAADTKIEEIRTLYKQKFAQESVLRATAMSKVSF